MGLSTRRFALCCQPHIATLAFKTMLCKLCLKDRELRNSHIVPEFLYKTLYEETGRFYELNLDKDSRTKFHQKGIRERLLCDECEQLFSKYERYASLLLNGGYELLVVPEPPVVHFKNIDYAKFKLFALSILWRAGVSTHKAYSQVKLGKHEELLRLNLLNESPGKQEEYPFVLMPVMHGGNVLESLIVSPEKTRVADNITYLFVFGGIAWAFIVSSHKPPQVVLDASLSPSGSLTMLPKQLKDMKHIVSSAQELLAQGKL